MSYAEKLAELAKLRDGEETKRRARDEQELDEQLFALASDPKNVFVRVPDAPSHLPGHVVCRVPGQPQIQRFREIMFRDSAQRGAVAAKAAARSGVARVRTRPRSLPACGSVRHMVASHSPVTSFSRYWLLSSGLAWCLMHS